jgi:hypothetical protein
MANEDTMKQVAELARLQHYKKREQAFITFPRGSLADTATRNLHIKNPSDSGVTVDVQQISVYPQFTGNIVIYDGFSSAPSGGTDASLDNLRMESGGTTPDTGNITTNEEVTFTESNTHLDIPIPGSGSGGAAIGENLEATKPLIDPGREIVVEAENTSGSTSPVGIVCVYAERGDLV